MPRVSVGSLLSHRSKKLCRRNVLCLRKTLLSKFLCRGAVGVTRLSVEIVFCHSTEIIRRWTLFCVSEKTGYRKILSMRIGYYSFLSKIFLSHSAGKLRREVLRCFGKNRISKKFRLKRGISLSCVGTCLCHSTWKLHRGTHLCFRRFLLSKKIMDKRVGLGREGGSITFVRQKHFI